MSSPCPFKYFGLPLDATKEEVARRYREMAMTNHPDKQGPDKQGNDEFINTKKMKEACLEILESRSQSKQDDYTLPGTLLDILARSVHRDPNSATSATSGRAKRKRDSNAANSSNSADAPKAKAATAKALQ